ncbi:hypothetical protein [Desulfosporosinus sp. SB140]|uniref:hypothetical protein n=1 Tax=Desulfosporosinus paludis TaxID=3115649 RepID=UPI0038910A72
MSSLVLTDYSPLDEKVKTETGDRSSQIWLLVNPKYPDVRQDIWLPILEVIQDKMFRKLRKRIDTGRIFMKTIVSDIGVVSRASNMWSTEIAEEIVTLRESILEYQPKILITFGSVTYELVTRILGINQEREPKCWQTTNLGDEFQRSMENFEITGINRIPLPLRALTKGKIINEYNYFSWEDCEDYFSVVGTKIADRILENEDCLKIWI